MTKTYRTTITVTKIGFLVTRERQNTLGYWVTFSEGFYESFPFSQVAQTPASHALLVKGGR